MNQQGTGDIICRIKLHEGLQMVVKDDGHNDPDVVVAFENPRGNTKNINEIIGLIRRETGDDDLKRGIERWFNINQQPRQTDTKPPKQRGPFVCAECNLTWPSKSNTNPGRGPNICAKCAEDHA